MDSEKILNVEVSTNTRKPGSILTFLIILFFFYCLPVNAKIISETLPAGMVVTAEYRQGESDKPTILVLHGFLQTYNFQATYNIIEGLAGLGYTVIGPNISLGVPNRKRSLQCDAIHQHTLTDDIEEINFWTQWALKQGSKKIIIVGHSWGGQHALAFMAGDKKSDKVAGVIAISLIPDPANSDVLKKQLVHAKELKIQSVDKLDKYALSFCSDYTATPGSYLSYAEWNDITALSALNVVSHSGIPVYAILGGADKRLRNDWVSSLKNAGAQISVVEGANHFFSSSYEFDLIDQLEGILNTLNSRAVN